jgi:FlaA1/EpsC-like NDP-sugar epimerase
MPKFTFPPLVPCVTSGVEGSSKCRCVQAPRLVKIIYTGSRRGEKLHEDLLGAGEVDVRSRHPLIAQVPVAAIASDRVSSVLVNGNAAVVAAGLCQVCEETTPPPPSQPPTVAGTSADRL